MRSSHFSKQGPSAIFHFVIICLQTIILVWIQIAGLWVYEYPARCNAESNLANLWFLWSKRAAPLHQCLTHHRHDTWYTWTNMCSILAKPTDQVVEVGNKSSIVKSQFQVNASSEMFYNKVRWVVQRSIKQIQHQTVTLTQLTVWHVFCQKSKYLTLPLLVCSLSLPSRPPRKGSTLLRQRCLFGTLPHTLRSGGPDLLSHRLSAPTAASRQEASASRQLVVRFQWLGLRLGHHFGSVGAAAPEIWTHA